MTLFLLPLTPKVSGCLPQDLPELIRASLHVGFARHVLRIYGRSREDARHQGCSSAKHKGDQSGEALQVAGHLHDANEDYIRGH